MLSTKSYILAYYAKTDASVTVAGGTQSNQRNGIPFDDWTYHETEITGATSVQITGSGLIDEVKLFPKVSLMTTYCYTPELLLQSNCGATGLITYYEYDALQRLHLIKDYKRNVIKAIDYNYSNLPAAN